MVLPQQLEIPTTEQGCDWVSAVPQPSAEVSVTVLRTVAELESLREVWTRWNRHPLCDLDFYLTILAVRPEVIRPHVIVAWQGGRPQTILIGRLEQKAFECKLGYFTLLQPKLRVITLLYDGLIGNASDEISNALLASLSLSVRGRETDAIVFEPIRIGSSLHQAITNDFIAVPRYVSSPAQHWVIRIDKNVGSALHHVSAKTRAAIRRKHKKLADSRAVRTATYTDPSALNTLFRDIESIAARTYHRRLGVGVVDSPEMRRRFALQASAGVLRGYVLYVDDRPAAFWVASLYKNVLHSGYMGYDPALAKYSPGLLLITGILEHAEQHVTCVDFGLGDAQYKQVLGTDSWSESLVYIFAPTFKGYWLSAVHNFVGHLDHFARLVLRRAGSLDKVKRAMRG